MAEFQTQVSDLTAVLRGSGKLEISPYQATDAFIDAGALSGLEVEEAMEVSKEENDNADADEVVSKQELTIKATLHEALKSSVWDILRGNFDKKTVIAGTPVSGATHTIEANVFAKGKLIVLPGQNANGSAQTITSITQGAVTLTDPDDYIQAAGPDGKWGIVPTELGDYDPTVAAVVTYGYTPPASVTIHSGSKTLLPDFKVRITTKNNGKPFRITVFKCKIKTGKKFSWPKDEDSDKRVKIPIEITAQSDPLYNLDSETGNGYLYKTEQQGGM